MSRKMLMYAGAVLVLSGFMLRPAAVRLAQAHCDTLDGPVVVEARAALEKGDITPVLKWVKAEAEPEIRLAFKQALAVRSKGPEAKELADRYFFETLVRLHRAGEGAPYTGLKPAGQVEPAVAAADQAIAEGRATELAKEIGQAAGNEIQARFALLIEAKKQKDRSVEAGRRYVEEYVTFVHYVEALHNLIHAGASHHAEEATPAHKH